MAKAYSCDCCHTLFRVNEAKQPKVTIGNGDKINLEFRGWNGLVYEITLCPDCRESFEFWWTKRWASKNDRTIYEQLLKEERAKEGVT